MQGVVQACMTKLTDRGSYNVIMFKLVLHFLLLSRVIAWVTVTGAPMLINYGPKAGHNQNNGQLVTGLTQRQTLTNTDLIPLSLIY